MSKALAIWLLLYVCRLIHLPDLPHITCLRQPLRRMFAVSDYCLQALSLRRSALDQVVLHGDFFLGHESTPPSRCAAIDSNTLLIAIAIAIAIAIYTGTRRKGADSGKTGEMEDTFPTAHCRKEPDNWGRTYASLPTSTGAALVLTAGLRPGLVFVFLANSFGATACFVAAESIGRRLAGALASFAFDATLAALALSRPLFN